jgi:hypothetical protein
VTAEREKWLILVQQLPASPSNARVKTWRRLQQLGALALKHSVYVLPNSPAAREDFEWIKSEIVDLKGQAAILSANASAAEEQEIMASFRRSRAADFSALRGEIESFARRQAGSASRGRARSAVARAVSALRDRLHQIEQIDFFAAPGRSEARAALDRLERRLAPSRSSTPPDEPWTPANRSEYRGRTWVTRPRPGIDRMASAWLIQRFIDPKARFTFAAALEGLSPQHVPFDMFDAEFSHHGGRCTFEVLLQRFSLDEPRLQTIAEIVHDVDLKDARYGAPAAPIVASLVEGLRETYPDDRVLLEQGRVMFEALYRSPDAAGRPPATANRGRRAPRAKRRRQR